MDKLISKYYQIPLVIRAIYIIVALLALSLIDLTFMGASMGASLYGLVFFTLEFMLFATAYQKLVLSRVESTK